MAGTLPAHANGTVLYANQSLARLINADPMALGAKELGVQLGLGDLVADGSRCADSESGDTGFDSREVRNPASGRWYLVRIGQIPWESRRLVNLQMLTDISAQKRARAMKQQHQDILHQTARLAALAEISSSLAHEVTRRISEELPIGIKTIEFHRARIREKLGVASQAQLFSLFIPSE